MIIDIKIIDEPIKNCKTQENLFGIQYRIRITINWMKNGIEVN